MYICENVLYTEEDIRLFVAFEDYLLEKLIFVFPFAQIKTNKKKKCFRCVFGRCHPAYVSKKAQIEEDYLRVRSGALFPLGR